MLCLKILPGIVEGERLQISCFGGHLGQLIEAMLSLSKYYCGHLEFNDSLLSIDIKIQSSCLKSIESQYL